MEKWKKEKIPNRKKLNHHRMLAYLQGSKIIRWKGDLFNYSLLVVSSLKWRKKEKHGAMSFSEKNF